MIKICVFAGLGMIVKKCYHQQGANSYMRKPIANCEVTKGATQRLKAHVTTQQKKE